MFDIKDYYCDNTDSITCYNHRGIGSVEEDISVDIDNLLKNRFDKLYIRDKFKRNHFNIEIIHPKLSYLGFRSLILGPDYIRFLLSLYPYKSDLENIDKIVIRPRHIEINDVELMSIYMRKKKILVLYLHHPHFYSLIDSKIKEYAEFIPANLFELSSTQINDCKKVRTLKTNVKIPALWYIMSIICHSEDDKIDKFLLKIDEKNDRKIQMNLDEISFYYSQHGY
jgi:hypothetical protein